MRANYEVRGAMEVAPPPTDGQHRRAWRVFHAAMLAMLAHKPRCSACYWWHNGYPATLPRSRRCKKIRARYVKARQRVGGIRTVMITSVVWKVPAPQEDAR